MFSSPQMLWSRVMLLSQLQQADFDPLAFYRMLEAYYLNNGLYDSVQAAYYEQGIWTPGMKSLRNPARRTVEFHVTHIWPGNLDKALPVLCGNKRILEPLQQVWKWSNWSVKKQLAARWFALYGDWFCKVATGPNPPAPFPTREGGVVSGAGLSEEGVSRVFLQNIKPEVVTDFEVDERGVVQSIRLDIPRGEGRMFTEAWDKLGYRCWQHKREAGAALESLGKPETQKELAEFGIDFVPFVHAAFVDIGEKRGVGAFSLALDKIDEANRMATRLHQLIFRYNKPTVAVMANAIDSIGRPMPAPKINAEQDARLNSTQPGLTITTVEHDDEVIGLPGMSKLEFMVPNLNYSAHLEAINAQMREIEEDLPELSYYRQKELGASISGKAVRLLLSQAVDKTLEARGNLESALARADMMALSMGVNAGLFKRIGSYEHGDFEHTFQEREVIPFSTLEQAEILNVETAAGVPLVTAARRHGWSEEELRQMEVDQKMSEPQIYAD